MPKVRYEIGSRYVVASLAPFIHIGHSAAREEYGRIHAPTVFLDRPSLERFLKRDGVVVSPRFYEARFVWTSPNGGALLFEAVRRLRISMRDHDETTEDAPGLDDAIRLVDGEIPSLDALSAPHTP